jgi:transposase
MNLKSGGKQPLMRPGTFNGQSQPMVFPDNHPIEELQGKAKGMRIVLIERGLWPESGKLLARCAGGCKNDVDSCCAEKILSLQSDFRSQKSLIAETIEAEGHKCIFYPKYHCELNYIEYFWGAAKRYCRLNCDYTWEGLKNTVPKALASIDLMTIRRFARRAQRYMSAYRNGLTLKAAEYAVKKYKSHRRIPDGVVLDFDE